MPVRGTATTDAFAALTPTADEITTAIAANAPRIPMPQPCALGGSCDCLRRHTPDVSFVTTLTNAVTENDAAVHAAEHNYLVAWRTLAADADGCRLEETDALMMTLLPDAPAFFNSAFVKPTADPVACIETARSFYGPSTAFTLRFRDSTEAHDACTAAGLSETGASPLMNVAVGEVVQPGEVEVRRSDRSAWSQHVACLAEGFGMPVALLSRVFGAHVADRDRQIAFDVYVDGEIASTATLIVSDDIAGIYNVATPERFRRRGFGEAATRAAVVEGGRRGCTIATLQSSEMGFRIYERMGFRTVASWRSFINARP